MVNFLAQLKKWFQFGFGDQTDEDEKKVSELILTQANHKESHAVPVGNTIKLRLTENPTTGYMWNVDELNPDLFEIVSDDYQSAGGGVGAGGGREVILRVKKAGSHSIALKHWQSWSGEESVTDRLEINIEGS